MRSILCFFLLAASLFAGSCTDPASEVGLDLLGTETNLQAKTVPATSFSTSPLVDITGAAPRVLVGAVDDPMTGQITAHGFLDFAGDFSGTPSDDIKNVRLRLSRNYNFGDTLKTVQFRVHQILKEWDQAGLKSNTDLEFGPAIMTVITQDTLTTVDLPASWVDTNENTLRSDDFNSEFHGFALIEDGSGQVFGFNSGSTVLLITSANGSTTYTVNSTYTQIDRSRPSDPPGEFLLFQDGSGPAIQVDFAFKEFVNHPINGMELIFRVDTVATQSAPENFVRPLQQILQLVAVPSDGTNAAVLIGQAQLSDEQYRFAGKDVSVFFQSVFFGDQDYARLELRAPVANHSLNAMLFHGTDAPDLSPQATIILSL